MQCNNTRNWGKGLVLTQNTTSQIQKNQNFFFYLSLSAAKHARRGGDLSNVRSEAIKRHKTWSPRYLYAP